MSRGAPEVPMGGRPLSSPVQSVTLAGTPTVKTPILSQPTGVLGNNGIQMPNSHLLMCSSVFQKQCGRRRLHPAELRGEGCPKRTGAHLQLSAALSHTGPHLGAMSHLTSDIPPSSPATLPTPTATRTLQVLGCRSFSWYRVGGVAVVIFWYFLSTKLV